MKIKKIFVVGSGAMGRGIAQAFAQAGYPVTMMDINKQMLKDAAESIEWSLNKLEEKGKLKEDKGAILARIDKSGDIQKAYDADAVIEAVPENLGMKQNIFGELEKICKKGTLLGTNTSTLPITEIASELDFPGRVVGIHFFNPVHRMKLVEIIKGLATSEETADAARELVLSIGKEPVMVNKDSAGFIVNRINGMALLEAIRLFERGVATVEDIDKAMRLGLGYPMGPFELMDMVGIDIVVNARMGVYNETRDHNHFPPDILRRMVKAGHLGRKTGKGFYDYS